MTLGGFTAQAAGRLGDAARECALPASAGFATWFAGSHVTDRGGCPLVVWHANAAGAAFDRFDFEGHAREVGMHFGSEAAARTFGEARPFYLALRLPLTIEDPGDWLQRWVRVNPADPANMAERSTGEVPTLTILLRDREIDRAEYDAAHATIAAYFAKAATARTRKARWDAGRVARASASALIRELIESKGYDGLRYINRTEDKGSVSWVAFHPWQIKSIHAQRFARTPNIFDAALGAIAPRR